MAEYRAMTGFQDLHLSHSPIVSLYTKRPITEEIFSSIRYVSEIEEVGYELIRSNGIVSKKGKKGSSLLLT
ncbi:MAG: hypothetical protein MAG551_01253 [Candidatus Scalindua arabica]|uniref:Uncharacterized protein n=1 Tax=Candidatus Scalindua arabica TaxID=1127984 RepID=A0A941W249_9BACT|nr:hypothetical protein [Candidatus Scalindua arabica]